MRGGPSGTYTKDTAQDEREGHQQQEAAQECREGKGGFPAAA